MKEIKVLNLYACLGGNRYKWDEVANEAEINMHVTAVELDPEAARLYQERFPNDTVIVADAHQYLLDHFKEFDFIWSSPPCPTHSSIRMSQKNRPTFENKYPDMKLYEEILLLQYQFNGKFIVENVIPYYEPLIPAQKRGRHLYWSNFTLPSNIDREESKGIVGNAKNELDLLCKLHDYDFRKYKGEQSTVKMARNLVDYEAGRTIFETYLGIHKKSNREQLTLEL
jgi:DNA (cytosine-5)-methyltransferase 1